MSNGQSFCKQVRFPDKPASKWVQFQVWWTIEVWGKHAPQWLHHHWSSAKHFWYEHISSVIWPKNKWATDVIPGTWADKNHLIEAFLFAAIKHFVSKDGEDCFGTTVWDEDDPQSVKLREIYAWVTEGRTKAEADADKLWSPGKVTIKDGKMVWGQTEGDFHAYCLATDAIEARDTEYLTWIVTNRGILWV